MIARTVAAAILTLMVVGCGSAPLGPAQLDVLHSRHYDAPPDVTFTATANALIDMGYHISVTDADGGIMRAERRRDPSIAEHSLWLTASTVLTFGHAPMLAPSDYFTMCILVAPEHSALTMGYVPPEGRPLELPDE
jgi:hypothetical protein